MFRLLNAVRTIQRQRLCHSFLCDVGGAVRLLWPFTETKFVHATLLSCQMRKVSYVATGKDILRSLSL